MNSTSISDLVNTVPMNAKTYPSTKVAFLCMVEAMFGFMFAWYPVLGSMSRITKTERASYWGQSAGYIIAMAFFVIIGVISSTLMGRLGVYSTDPTDWLMKLNSPIWAAISIFAIALANITTQTLGCYCLSLATKIFKPSWNYRVISGLYTVLVIIMIFWQGIWTYYNMFLAATAIIGAPACAIILVDYFIIRKGKFSMRSVFMIKNEQSYKYTFGFNIPAFAAFLLAVITYLLIYDPIKYVVKNEALMKFTPTGIAFIVSAVVYFLFSKIPSVKAYILKDSEEILEEDIVKETMVR
jgi:NCS1 family nucleobase:cation symporter-1